ncbi:MAG TPA: DUF421 domain-containing protein [Desulfobacteria bacterium]|nr:DUF421 domain-containing protein [Desulfobacteria bacterium]
MLIVLLRTLLLYSFVVIFMRIMGKRQIGQLQPFELVVTLMLSELAAIPMQNTGIPLINGIIPILTLVVAQIVLSFVSLKSERVRGIICGTPSVLIENGRIVEPELERLRYNLSDLLEQLRAKNVPNISDVEFAILETSGQLSVIPKSQKRPVVPEDMNLSTDYEGIPYTVIMDGHVIHKNLTKMKLDIPWLDAELKRLGIEHPQQVLFASVDSQGRLYYQKKNDSPGGRNH